jgi:ABC-type multidrug transport system fused ATPase/permease subunit
LDQYASNETEGSTDSPVVIETAAPDPDVIGFNAASFTWSNEDAKALTDGTLTPSKRRFRLRIDEELVFKRGKINLIVGVTGAGKTSLLMALLGTFDR